MNQRILKKKVEIELPYTIGQGVTKDKMVTFNYQAILTLAQELEDLKGRVLQDNNKCETGPNGIVKHYWQDVPVVEEGKKCDHFYSLNYNFPYCRDCGEKL